MAWVSERIASDLRNETYEHLQQLSLEYFGGKRTGDLMRGSAATPTGSATSCRSTCSTSRTDVLMIVDDGGDPAVASTRSWRLATLVPFPLIAWLVHQVRDRSAARLPARRAGPGPR